MSDLQIPDFRSLEGVNEFVAAVLAAPGARDQWTLAVEDAAGVAPSSDSRPPATEVASLTADLKAAVVGTGELTLVNVQRAAQVLEAVTALCVQVQKAQVTLEHHVTFARGGCLKLDTDGTLHITQEIEGKRDGLAPHVLAYALANWERICLIGTVSAGEPITLEMRPESAYGVSNWREICKPGVIRPEDVKAIVVWNGPVDLTALTETFPGANKISVYNATVRGTAAPRSEIKNLHIDRCGLRTAALDLSNAAKLASLEILESTPRAREPLALCVPPSLRSLLLLDVSLTSLDSICGLPCGSLTSLSVCGGLPDTELNFAAYTALERLELSKLAKLKTISGVTSRHLEIFQVQDCTKLGPELDLTACAALEKAGICGSPDLCLVKLQGCNNIIELKLTHAGVSHLDLSSCAGRLQRLDLSNTGITLLDDIIGLQEAVLKLKVLGLSGNRIPVCELRIFAHSNSNAPVFQPQVLSTPPNARSFRFDGAPFSGDSDDGMADLEFLRRYGYTKRAKALEENL